METLPRVIVVEDDTALRVDLVEYLNLHGFECFGAAHADHLRRQLHIRHADLLILDIGLPEESGLSLLPRMRATYPHTGIIILSAFSDTRTRVDALEQGADVYLTKDASLEVVHAAAAALWRRLAAARAAPSRPSAPSDAGSQGDLGSPGNASHRSAGDPPKWRLDAARSRLLHSHRGGVELSHAEAVFLEPLLAAPGRIHSREELLRGMHRPATLANLRNLDGCATRIRRKVEQALALELPLRSMYGRGYVFAHSEEAVE